MLRFERRSFMHRSLLVQLLSVYLLFVAVVLATGEGVNAIVEHHLRDDVQASDQALARAIAEQTRLRMSDALSALQPLGALALHAGTNDAMAREFQAFMDARSDILHVSWLDPFGGVLVSVARTTPGGLPAPDPASVGLEFSPSTLTERILQDARALLKDGQTCDTATASSPVYEVGIAQETTPEAGVIIAQPFYDPTSHLIDPQTKCPLPAGIVATSLSLGQLSTPLQAVADAQYAQGHTLKISIVDDKGALIASSYTPKARGLLYGVLDELPGAAQALQGQPLSQVARGTDGQDWLFSAVPVPRAGWMAPNAQTGWAVVVQRPASRAFAVVADLHVWLLLAALIFALGGLVFWLLLLHRVIWPLHGLAARHQALPTAEEPPPAAALALTQRDDEVGGLARSLARLERDVLAQLGELRTLLETSTAVVGSLDPQAVVGTIIHEVRRLVDVQAAAVLVPDEQSMLRVLVSEGHGERYDRALSLAPEDVSSAAVLALRDGQPVQRLHEPDEMPPSLAYQEGFRTVLAIPIVSRHVGGVVLLVHRTEAQPFSENEIDLLLTFANYATLAWEHAVLYERSDERLREVASENERLYRQANEERQTLAAIMGSMSDGLILTGVDGVVLYANRGASVITGLPVTCAEGAVGLVGSHIASVHAALRAAAERPEQYDRARAQAEAGEVQSWLLEMTRDRHALAIHLRLFDVRDADDRVVGRGLLLRDVTREHEMDQFKSTLLAAVGHELRTPLAAIKGNASTLLQRDVTWPEEDQRHFLSTISSEADRLAQLVTNLLDLSRLEAGLLALHRAPSALASLVADAARRLSVPPADLRIAIPADLPPLDVDAARIEVVLQNLLGNAVTYGDGSVRVEAKRQGDMAQVSVANDGPGISAEDLPHIFERFYRAPRGRKLRSGGTGLGLAICKAFVEAHGGAIWAESGGQGTIISFSLPLALSAGEPAPEQPFVTGLTRSRARSRRVKEGSRA